MARPALKLGSRIRLHGAAGRVVERDGEDSIVAVHLDCWNLPVTFYASAVTRLAPATEGIADGEPLQVEGTISRLSDAPAGRRDVSIRLGMMPVTITVRETSLG